MKSYVIYTVITGGYEDILQPLVIDDRFDYILFTDSARSYNIGAWNVRPIHVDESLDKIRLSRYPKSHPVSLLSEYEASLYIDANIQIKDNWIYSRFIELVENKIEYAGVKLVVTGRDCIYDHAFDMCVMGVEHDYTGIKQCNELYRRNFPSHFGLNENNIIFRMHTAAIEKVDNDWWYWITNYSRRDQFSYMYCLWNNKIPIKYILPEGEDARNSSHFNFVVHNNKPVVVKRKKVKKSLFEKVRLLGLLVDTHEGINIWTNCYKSGHPILKMYILSFVNIVKNIPAFWGVMVKRCFYNSNIYE